MLLFTISAWIAVFYCLARSVVDLRAKRYIWGAMGIISAVLFVSAPVQTHAVKIDLPAPLTGN